MNKPTTKESLKKIAIDCLERQQEQTRKNVNRILGEHEEQKRKAKEGNISALELANKCQQRLNSGKTLEIKSLVGQKPKPGTPIYFTRREAQRVVRELNKFLDSENAFVYLNMGGAGYGTFEEDFKKDERFKEWKRQAEKMLFSSGEIPEHDC